jgi:hypothetical protein
LRIVALYNVIVSLESLLLLFGLQVSVVAILQS